MMKTIFIALALTSLFLGTQAAYVNICADANCITCLTNAATACTACKTGYFLDPTAKTCTSCNGATPAGCTTCTSATVCGTAAAGYFLNTATPVQAVSCNGATPAGCTTCASTIACQTAAAGYFLNTATPVQAVSCNGATPAGCATCATAIACQTAAAGYFLNTATPVQAVQCADTFNAATCSAADTAVTCSKGTMGAGICCGAQNCGTCATSIVAGVTGANVVCAACSGSYTLFSGTCNCVANCLTCASATLCTTCMSGFTATGTTPAITACVATTPVPSTNSPSTAAFNVTPTAVFLNTETSTPAFTGQTGSVVYGAGFDSSTEYVWGIVTPTLTTGTVVVNRRTLNGTFGGSLAKLNSSDTSITTAIPFGAYQSSAVAPGYLALASYVAPTNWGGVNSLGAVAAATIGEISITYIAVNGTSAMTKALTGNTNANAYFSIQNLWIDTGVIYCTYTMSTHTPGTAAGTAPATADVWALNGIYIQAVVISSGALLYNTTGGIKAITLTQSTSGSPVGCVNQVGTGCVSTAPSSSVSNFLVCGNNITNSSLVNYVWQDASATASVVKTGTITLATGAGTAGTVLNTDVAAVGTASVLVPTVATSYTVGGCLGSFATSGVFVNKAVTTDTGVALTGATTVYSTLAYINGTATASSNITVTIVSGYRSPAIQGYGTSDGFILVESHRAQTTPTSGQNKLIQVERFFTNGSLNGAAVNLGTYYDAPNYHQDANGSIYIGYTVTDTNNGKSYAGYLGKYLAQTLASGASTLTSIFAFLSLMIVALFAF